MKTGQSLSFREIRVQRCLKQEDIAREAGISVGLYSLLERHLRHTTKEKAKKITAMLGVPDRWEELVL